MNNKKVIGWIIVLVGIIVAVCVILSTKPKETMEWGLLFGIVFGIMFSIARRFTKRKK